MTKREGPHVDPSLAANPAVQKYAAAIRERRGPPQYNVPVAGGPTPPIPVLNHPHRDGMTMADQAAEALFPSRAQSEGQEPSMFQGPLMHRTGGGQILPGDLLPEQATQDPQFQQGAGSRYAINQPHLAMKYGVIRNGQFLAPQQLSTGRPGLRPETIQGLEMLQKAQQPAPQPETPPDPTGPGAAAARIGNGPGDEDIGPVKEADRERIKGALEKMDDFDFHTFRDMMVKDILNNEEQRKIIEARLKPLDINDLIIHGKARQVVPIVEGRFEPEFQSVSAEEALALKRIIVSEAKSLDVSDRYLLDKHSFMELAAGLYAINKKPLPSQFDQNGNFNEDAFLKKFNLVIKYPLHMLSSLGINYFWFEVRVRSLFKAETIKNG